MHWSVLAGLCLVIPGCILEPGLEGATTKCPPSQALVDGFRLTVADPGRLVGRCVSIAHEGNDIDQAFALRKLGSDGVAYLPIAGPGRYYMQVSATDEDDKYCATHVGEYAEHPGTGVVLVNGTARGLCS